MKTSSRKHTVCPGLRFSPGAGVWFDFTANLTYFSQGWPQYLLSIHLKLIIVILDVQSLLSGVLHCVCIFRSQSGMSNFFL